MQNYHSKTVNKVGFGIGALLEKPFNQMYGEEIAAGGTYFFAGLLCCLIKDRIAHIFINLIQARVMSFPGSRV